MATPNPAKRRRLDDVTRTLKQPFVSPMRTSNAQSPLKENISKGNIAPPRQYVPSTLAHTIVSTAISPATNAESREPSKIKQAIAPPKIRSSISPPKTTPARRPPLKSWSYSKTTDPELLSAQKAITSLEFQIKKVQSDLDTLIQASQISTSTTDADLELLTSKWRTASQAAADELFDQVKERVQRMGGVAAWREMEQTKYERQNGLGEFTQEKMESDDEDCEFDSEGEELPEKEVKYRKEMKRQARQEIMDLQDVPDVQDTGPAQVKAKVWQDDGKDDDSFTMDMMLRSLNISLTLIGYDKQMQRWI